MISRKQLAAALGINGRQLDPYIYDRDLGALLVKDKRVRDERGKLRDTYTDESAANFLLAAKARRDSGRHTIANRGPHACAQVHASDIMHARYKPAGVSDARWRIELARRARARAGHCSDLDPDSISGGGGYRLNF